MFNLVGSITQALSLWPIVNGVMVKSGAPTTTELVTALFHLGG